MHFVITQQVGLAAAVVILCERVFLKTDFHLIDFDRLCTQCTYTSHTILLCSILQLYIRQQGP